MVAGGCCVLETPLYPGPLVISSLEERRAAQCRHNVIIIYLILKCNTNIQH